jgi:hypothetical protein
MLNSKSLFAEIDENISDKLKNENSLLNIDELFELIDVFYNEKSVIPSLDILSNLS